MSENPDPQQLFARQALRTALVETWFDALDLRPGDSVADFGCGAGYVSLRAAQRVGPGGTVHAVDTDATAIGFLQALADLHRLHQINCRVDTLEGLSPLPAPPRGTILSMVLHHVDDRARALRRIAQSTQGAPILIAEFDHDGPCKVGPPRTMRISRDTLEAAVAEAGLAVTAVTQQTDEHWFLLCSAR